MIFFTVVLAGIFSPLQKELWNEVQKIPIDTNDRDNGKGKKT